MPLKNPEDIKYMHPVMLGAAPPDLELMVDTIHKAEGGDKARVAYGVTGIPVKDASEARQIAMNTVRNQYKRWQDAGQPGTFLESLATRYVDKKKDPQGWKNWMVNVPLIYSQMEKQRKEASGQQVMPNFPAPIPSFAYRPTLRDYSAR